MSKAGSSTKGTAGKVDPTEGFVQGAIFYDTKKFPRGFNKYGEFTKDEATLLHSFGRCLQDLQQGDKKPENKQQKQFLAVCRGDRQPEGFLEKTWMKYQKLLNRKTKVVNPFGSSTQVNEGDSMVVPADLEEDLDDE